MTDDPQTIAAVMTVGAKRLPSRGPIRAMPAGGIIAGEQPDPAARLLVQAAALAQEMFGDDDLERWATEPRAGRDPDATKE